MAQLKPKSLPWPEQLDALRAYRQGRPTADRAELKNALDHSDSQITILLNLDACLDPQAMDRVRQAAKGNPSFELSFNGARALTRLKGRVPDLPGAVHTALDLALSRRMTPKPIGALVDWIISGKPVAGFDPSEVKNKKKKQGAGSPMEPAHPNLGRGLEAPVQGAGSPMESPKGAGQAHPNPVRPLLGKSRLEAAAKGGTPLSMGEKLALAREGLGREVQKLKELGSRGKGSAAGVKGFKKAGKRAAKVFWHWSLKPIHHFFKAAARWAVPSSSPGLTAFLRWVVYGLCQLVFWWALLGGLAGHFAPGLKSWVEYPFRYLAGLVAIDLPAWAMRLAHEHWAWAIFIGVFLGLVILGALFAHPLRMGLLLALMGAVWFYGRGWGTEKLPWSSSPRTTAIEPSPVAGLAMGDKPSTAPISEAPAPRENSIAGQTTSTLKKTRAPSSHVPPVPEELRDRMEKDSGYTLDFAEGFYGMSYDRYRDWYDWLEDRVSDDYHDPFFKEFDIPSKWREIDGQKLTLSFEPSGKPGLIRWDDVSDDFRVEGVLTTRSDKVYARKLISRKRAALVISFRHKPNGDGSVTKVKETKPAQ